MQGRMVLESCRFQTESVITLPERVGAAIAGVICLLPAWEFFGRHRVDPFQIGYLPFWFIMLAAGCMSLTFFAGAILGDGRTVIIDATARTLEIRHRIWRYGWTSRWGFEDLEPAVAVEDNWSDGPSTWDLTIATTRGKRLVLRSFSVKADAEAAKSALDRMLAA